MQHNEVKTFILELSDPDFNRAVFEQKNLLKQKFKKLWQDRLAKDPFMDEIIFDYREIFQPDTTAMSQAEAELHRDILEAVGIRLNNQPKS